MGFLRSAILGSFSKVVSVAFLCFILSLSCRSFCQDVLTYHNNNARTGLNNKETILTPANVNMASFGKLFALPVDSFVDAQPLYLSGVMVGSKKRNLVIVATEHASVYAFDADTGVRIWHDTTVRPGETSSDNRGCGQVPAIGVTSTPVILRPNSGKPVIYFVSMSKDSAGKHHQRLHAVDAASGAELYGGAVDIRAKFPGTGDNSSGGYVIFDPAQYKERAALLLIGRTVYLSWASHCDIRPYTGWIMGYDTATLTQTTVLNITPNGNMGGIWSSASGMAADGAGNIFLLDGNGDFDTTMNASGFPANGDFGNAFLKLSTNGGLAVADYFEMYNQAQENGSDIDLGSGAAVLVTPKDSTGKVHQLAIGAGKDTNIYVVDRTNMGKFNSTTNKVYQELKGALPGGVWSMPAVYNNRVYYGPVGSPILAFKLYNAKLVATPVAHTVNSFGYPGATPSVSANGGTNGIVWAASNGTPGILHAYDATTLLELYNSSQAPNSRDQYGAGNKFVTPTIANGKVYVGNATSVAVFGLLPPQ
jgi:hypothetical protein